MDRRTINIIILASMALSTLLLGGGTWIIRNGRMNHFNMEILAKPDSYFFGMAIFFLVIFGIAFCAGMLGLWMMCTSGNLVVYAWIIQAIILASIINGMVCMGYKDEILDVKVGPTLKRIVRYNYGQHGQDRKTSGYDALQKDFHCCGADNGTVDWEASAWRRDQLAHGQNFVPDSCCTLPLDRYMCNAAATRDMPSRDRYVWLLDCKTALHEYIRICFWAIFGITVVFCVLQIVLLIALLYHITEQEAAFYPLAVFLICLKCLAD